MHKTRQIRIGAFSAIALASSALLGACFLSVPDRADIFASGEEQDATGASGDGGASGTSETAPSRRTPTRGATATPTWSSPRRTS